MTIQISKSQFRAKALELMRRIEATGEPVIITNHGKPTLEIRKLTTDRPAQDIFERLKGSVLSYEGPFDPVGEDEWEALK